MARPASLVSAIATEAIWDSGEAVPDPNCHLCRTPERPEAAIVATYCPICGPNAYPRYPPLRSRPATRSKFSAVSPPAPGLIICNNKVLRPIRRFCSGVPVPVTQILSPQDCTASKRSMTQAQSSPRAERTENMNAAVASTARYLSSSGWAIVMPTLLVRPRPPRLNAWRTVRRFGSVQSLIAGPK